MPDPAECVIRSFPEIIISYAKADIAPLPFRTL
jgi:hypothetical protein